MNDFMLTILTFLALIGVPLLALVGIIALRRHAQRGLPLATPICLACVDEHRMRALYGVYIHSPCKRHAASASPKGAA